MIKIGSRCWRRRMGKVVIWSKGERIAYHAWAQLERATGPFLPKPGATSAFDVKGYRLQLALTGREK